MPDGRLQPKTPVDLRLPWADLRRFVNCTEGAPVDDGRCARILGVSRSSVWRLDQDPSSTLALWYADLLACRLGVHPFVVWGEAWFERVGDPELRNPHGNGWSSSARFVVEQWAGDFRDEARARMAELEAEIETEAA